MARRRNRSMTGTERQVRRDITNVATRHRVHDLPIRPIRRSVPLPLLEHQDFRQWHPAPLSKPLRRLGGASARLKVATPARPVGGPVTFPYHKVAFRDATRVVLCVRRQVRRQIIHALGKAGGKVRRPRFNRNSQVSCRS